MVLHFDQSDLLFVFLGISMFAAAFLPRLLWRLPVSMPMAVLAFGFTVFSLPFGLHTLDLLKSGAATEKLAEAVVVISLMGAGLKIDRPFGWSRWQGTWRLLGITMPLSIAAAAWAGWWIAGLAPAAALLVGAAIAPTDPVLASEIQVGPPRRGSRNAEVAKEGDQDNAEEDEFRFVLTSEAGLNDGMAFPFVYAALSLAVNGTLAGWTSHWFAFDFTYRIIGGLLCGLILGKLLGRIILAIPMRNHAATAMVGPGALAATLIIYGATEYIDAYGFLAVFVGAVAIRSERRDHDYHESLHSFSEMAERVLTATVLLALGGALAGGLLAPLNWKLSLVAVLTVLVIRPMSGMAGMIGFTEATWRERIAISFFGVRGIGSIYYMAFALDRHVFPEASRLWAFVGLVVVISIVVHGMLAAPVTRLLDRHGQR